MNFPLKLVSFTFQTYDTSSLTHHLKYESYNLNQRIAYADNGPKLYPLSTESLAEEASAYQLKCPYIPRRTFLAVCLVCV